MAILIFGWITTIGGTTSSFITVSSDDSLSASIFLPSITLVVTFTEINSRSFPINSRYWGQNIPNYDDLGVNLVNLGRKRKVGTGLVGYISVLYWTLISNYTFMVRK